MNEYNVIDPITKKYNRNISSDILNLKNEIKAMYSNNSTIITTSGLHAITTTILSIAISQKWNSFNLIYSDEMYSETHRFLFDFSLTYSKINTWPINVYDTSRILEIFNDDIKDQYNVLFIESCSNPNSKIIDWSIIDKLRCLSKKLIVIVDNTWLTHVIFNPFYYGANIVVCSLTKYYSGGTQIMGACIFDESCTDLYNVALKKNNYEGIHVNPSSALSVINSMKNMDDRIISSNKLLIKVLDLLISLPNEKKLYEEIIHPYIQGNKSNELAHKYFKSNLYPTVFTISVKCKFNKFKKILLKYSKQPDSLPKITSFGSAKSKINPYPDSITYEVTNFRISIGYEVIDPNVIFNKIMKLLLMIYKTEQN